jgi:tetratricopeptide (TPR) repeat protein
MTAKRSWMLLLCGLALSTITLGPAAFGQEKQKTEGSEKGAKKKGKKKKISEEEKLLVQQFSQKAISLYEKEQYEEALAYFMKVDEILPTSFTFYHIAKCYSKLYKYDQAYIYYKAYVESGDTTNLDEVIESIDNIEAMSVVLKVVSSPDDAVVFVDNEEVANQTTPVIVEVSGGKHVVLVKKKGYKDVREVVTIPYGAEAKVAVTLEQQVAYPASPEEEESVQEEEEEEIEEEVEPEPEPAPAKKKSVALEEEVKPRRGRPSFSISLAAGVTVSTTKTLGSNIDASLGVFYRIKQAFAGIGIDNLFFTGSYLLAAYPAGGYTFKVWRDLSISLAGGFGFAWFYAFRRGAGTDGGLAIEKGGHWDLVAHADVKVRYRLGPILLQAIPLHADVLIGVGSFRPAPLAQFAFLIGLAYDF